MGVNMLKPSRGRAVWLSSLTALALLASASVVSAETKLMPNRSFKTGIAEVVWGISTQAAGTTCTLDYGDGSAPTNCNATDRSYIAFTHSYALADTYDVTLTVNGEVATTEIAVYNPASISDFEERELDKHRAVQNGLRGCGSPIAPHHLRHVQPDEVRQHLVYRPRRARVREPRLRAPQQQHDAERRLQKYLVQRGMNYIGHDIRRMYRG